MVGEGSISDAPIISSFRHDVSHHQHPQTRQQDWFLYLVFGAVDLGQVKISSAELPGAGSFDDSRLNRRGR